MSLIAQTLLQLKNVFSKTKYFSKPLNDIKYINTVKIALQNPENKYKYTLLVMIGFFYLNSTIFMLNTFKDINLLNHFNLFVYNITDLWKERGMTEVVGTAMPLPKESLRFLEDK